MPARLDINLDAIVAKQRHGAIGRVEVGFQPARVRFTNLDRKYSVTDSRE